MTDDWRARLEAEREQKAEYFASHPRSPIPEGHDFAGLSHFPIDPAYRFEVELHEDEDREQLAVETTTEGERQYVRWGSFEVTVDGVAVTVHAYKPATGEDRLWVPFRDATSGDSTYGAGRYIDLDPEDHQSDDGRWILDFNAAYNPTCAYNHGFECPLPPRENWLDVAIEAGEKDYPGDPVEPGHHH